MSRLDIITEYFPDATFLSADGLEDAIIGVDRNSDPPRLIYSISRILEILMEGDDEPDEEGYDKHTRAIEYFEFNTLCAYVGEQTPIFCDDEMFEK